MIKKTQGGTWMITESFLNSCFSLLLNQKSKIKKTKALYRDILEILDFSEQRDSYEIPVDIKSKLDCLRKISQMLIDDKTIDSVRDSISLSEKFKDHMGLLDLKTTEEVPEAAFQDYVRQVRIRKKISALFKNYDDLNNVLETIKDGSFDSIDDLVEDYEITIKNLYSNMMEAQRSVTIEAAASLDLVEDSYDHVIEMIRKKYERTSKTPTGFNLLDNKIMLGGYEPSRLYIWGGGSGAGKSTMLNNTIIRSATIDPIQDTTIASKFVPGEITRVYIYITMENTIEESLMRTYQPLFNKTSPQMLADISSGIDIKKRVSDELSKCGSTIVMKYFPAMSVSTLDIMGVVDDVIDKYGKDAIAGLYIDYLDLLKTDMKYDMYRLELGHITLSLKTLAVQYNIPVITGSQLGRRVYSIQASNELNLDQMSESIKKVEHADFVALIAKDASDNKVVHGKIGKNRAGESNISVDFAVDFSRFKFNTVQICANKEKDDGTCQMNAGLKFTGIDPSF
jgi:replicative DNA helicase